jgi:hypothetical protein
MVEVTPYPSVNSVAKRTLPGVVVGGSIRSMARDAIGCAGVVEGCPGPSCRCVA